MAKTWLSITVELLGGRGQELWPPPGRVFAVGPAHTFEIFADAINTAFARWDRAHLSMFDLADGSIVAPEETGMELANSSSGPLSRPVDSATAKVSKLLPPGSQCQFTFDLGDDWIHSCTVSTTKVDPLDTLGIIPSGPLPYWGWGDIPDQYGRVTENDDGSGDIPDRPGQRHPMLARTWPHEGQQPDVDLGEVRAAIATQNAARLVGAMTGCRIDDALQQIASGVPLVLASMGDDGATIALSLVNRLNFRGFRGDSELAEVASALLQGQQPDPGVPAVDAAELVFAAEGFDGEHTGAYVDRNTGEIVSAFFVRSPDVDPDERIDIDDDPERWLFFEGDETRDSWNDMAAFAEARGEGIVRSQLLDALDGKGAFRRFRDATDRLGLVSSWRAYSEDRRIGRAREFLAVNGLRLL